MSRNRTAIGIIEAAVRDLCKARGLDDSDTEVLAKDLGARLALLPTYAPAPALRAPANKLSRRQRERFVEAQAAEFIKSVHGHIDAITGFFVQRLVDLAVELQKARRAHPEA